MKYKVLKETTIALPAGVEVGYQMSDEDSTIYKASGQYLTVYPGVIVHSTEPLQFEPLVPEE